MFCEENLLRNEFFPAELPPCFNTNDLADKASTVIKWAKSSPAKCSVAVIYSGFKSETSRRRFAVPNPCHYCKAVNTIVSNQKEIFLILDKSKFSVSAPRKIKPNRSEAYRKKLTSMHDTKAEIEELYQDNMYEIRLDINSFFDNVYTHSLPWAIHGKNIAKKDHSTNLWGNRLDTVLRDMNSKQTNGILVGNAVSRIVSEILLCVVDNKVKNKYPDVSCIRFVDDYFIYLKDSSQIKPIMSFVRQCLGEFELAFNENKIQINESPFVYGKPWVEQIKQYIHLNPEVFLSKIIIEYNNYKDISILRYGLKVISLNRYDDSTWATMQSKLINLWVRFPSLSDLFIIIFLQNKDLLHKTKVVRALYTIMDNCFLIGHEQEIIWAVWYFKVLDLKMSQEYVKQILESDNSLAIIILLDIIKARGSDDNKVIKRLMDDLFVRLSEKDTDEETKNDCKTKDNGIMWTDSWLLAYEVDLNGWLNDASKISDFARITPFFDNLIKQNIEFYNSKFLYEEVEKGNGCIQFATMKDLQETYEKLKKAITDSLKDKPDKEKIVLNLEKNELIEKLTTAIMGNGYY